MRIMRLPVRRSRPLIRRSNLTYAPPSTVAASKTEIASSESIKRRALVTVEYGTGSCEPGGVEREDAIRIEPGGLVVRDREALMRIAETDN